MSDIPLLRQGLTTPLLMWDVGVALLPVVLAALWFFGLSALLVLLSAVLGAVLTEWALSPSHSLRDGSAVVAGVLLGLTLTPSVPLWMAFLGGVSAIGLGKLIWGGLGQNPFNPALVGRLLLTVSFPAAMTHWVAPRQGFGEFFALYPGNLALPLARPEADAVTAATPLALFNTHQQVTPHSELLAGSIPGCLGETSAGVILLSGLYLVLRERIDWRIPVGILATVAIMAGGLHLADPVRFPDPLFALGTGSLLFGAVFLATDPVTSPVTLRGTWWFAVGIGLWIVMIRAFGSLPEGVLFAILLMNAATPLIDRITRARPFGHPWR